MKTSGEPLELVYWCCCKRRNPPTRIDYGSKSSVAPSTQYGTRPVCASYASYHHADRALVCNTNSEGEAIQGRVGNVILIAMTSHLQVCMKNQNKLGSSLSARSLELSARKYTCQWYLFKSPCLPVETLVPDYHHVSKVRPWGEQLHNRSKIAGSSTIKF